MPSPRQIAEEANDRSKFEAEPTEAAEEPGGEAREADYRANPVNPPAGPVPARNLKGY
jgi:hypothetical protein